MLPRLSFVLEDEEEKYASASSKAVGVSLLEHLGRSQRISAQFGSGILNSYCIDLSRVVDLG